MTDARTSIKTTVATRDKLNALTPKGRTMEDTLRMLIAEHESRRMRQRMAWEARLERAQADPQAVVWAEREADRLAKYLEDRQAGGR